MLSDSLRRIGMQHFLLIRKANCIAEHKKVIHNLTTIEYIQGLKVINPHVLTTILLTIKKFSVRISSLIIRSNI